MDEWAYILNVSLQLINYKFPIYRSILLRLDNNIPDHSINDRAIQLPLSILDLRDWEAQRAS